MAYASWTKGSAALVLAARALARAEGVEEALLAEWALSQPGLDSRSERAAHSAAAKGWRWVAEMEEIAETMAAAGLPDGFHRAAAEIYRRSPGGDADPDAVLSALLRPAVAGTRRRVAARASAGRAAVAAWSAGLRFFRAGCHRPECAIRGPDGPVVVADPVISGRRSRNPPRPFVWVSTGD